jgi:hypothetical protein
MEPFPFPHSPPGMPSQRHTTSPSTISDPPHYPEDTPSQGPASPESSDLLSTQFQDAHLTQGNIHNPDADKLLGTDPSAEKSTHTLITFLTLNGKKAGANNTSLTDVVTPLENNDPDVLFLTKTPPHQRSGPLTHVLRNRGYYMHHHPSNAQSPSDIQPEARIPARLTHRGGC